MQPAASAPPCDGWRGGSSGWQLGAATKSGQDPVERHLRRCLGPGLGLCPCCGHTSLAGHLGGPPLATPRARQGHLLAYTTSPEAFGVTCGTPLFELKGFYTGESRRRSFPRP